MSAPWQAAVVPSAPLLVPALAGGSAPLDEQLRAAARAAVSGLLTGPGPLVVVGDAPVTGPVQGGWDWRGFGLPARDPSRPRLPLALALGDWLLDDAGAGGDRRLVGVGADRDAGACRRLGAELGASGPVRLLVVADGTATRTEKAPGYFDPRAEAFDARLVAGLATGDPDVLAELDPALATALLCSGRAGLQVLAGAVGSRAVTADLLWSGAPYGVAYAVARWSVA